MTIVKHREILDLCKEVQVLEKEYQDKQSAVVDVQTDKLLSAAVKEFIEYVQCEGFIVNGNEKAIITAD